MVLLFLVHTMMDTLGLKMDQALKLQLLPLKSKKKSSKKKE